MIDLFFYSIVIILVCQFLLGVYLEFINLKNSKDVIPPQLKGFYNENKFSLQYKYEKETTRFGMLKSSLSFLVTITIVTTGLFGYADEWLRAYYHDEFWLSAIWFSVS